MGKPTSEMTEEQILHQRVRAKKSLYFADNICGIIKPLTKKDVLNSLPVLVRLRSNQKEKLLKLIGEK